MCVLERHTHTITHIQKEMKEKEQEKDAPVNICRCAEIFNISMFTYIQKYVWSKALDRYELIHFAIFK